MQTGSLQSMTDEELVRLTLCGRIHAYDVLVIRFRRAVLLVAEQALHRRELAEDVTQEVFVVAFQSLSRLRDPTRFSSWLYAITRYRARRALKAEQRTVPMEPESMHAISLRLSASDAMHPEGALLNELLKDELARAVAGLKPDLRLVFQLWHEEDWPIARISEFLALPVTTIQWRLHQIRKLFKEQLLAQERETEHE